MKILYCSKSDNQQVLFHTRHQLRRNVCPIRCLEPVSWRWALVWTAANSALACCCWARHDTSPLNLPGAASELRFSTSLPSHGRSVRTPVSPFLFVVMSWRLLSLFFFC